MHPCPVRAPATSSPPAANSGTGSVRSSAEPDLLPARQHDGHRTHSRGSPVGRERKTEELSRNSVDDINIEGHDGFIAVGQDPTLGANLCEIAIQYNDDFIEWSISFSQQPFPDPCDVAKELTRQSIVNAK